LDKLTYAGSLAAVAGNTRHKFKQVDIVEAAALRPIVRANIVGTLSALSHWRALPRFRRLISGFITSPPMKYSVRSLGPAFF
jgi:hypothetical protein